MTTKTKIKFILLIIFFYLPLFFIVYIVTKNSSKQLEG